MPRRPIPFARLAALVLSLAAAGCDRSARPSCGALCGTAIILIRGEPDALMPGVVQSTDAIAMSDLLFLKLADIGPSLNTVGDSGFLPRLARSWRVEDSVTIAFALDPRARWQDGVPVRADDVVFSFDLFRDSVFSAPQRSSLMQVASVTARDSLTAVVKFRAPYPEEFYDATYQVRVLPRHLLDTIPRARLGAHPFVRKPVGDGPYRLARWRAGEAIEFVADTGFFLGKPGLGRLVWRVGADPTANVAQLVAGEADVISTVIDPGGAERVRKAPTTSAIEYRSPTYLYLGFNLHDPANPARPHPLLGDRDLRRAIVMAVDRPAVIRTVLGGLGVVPPGPVSPMEWIWSDRDPRAQVDTAEASRTLDRLGWTKRGPDGIRTKQGRRLSFSVIFPSFSQIRLRTGEVIQDQLKRVGVDMQLQPLEGNIWADRANRGRFDALLGSWQTDPTPASVLQTWTSSGIGGYNFQRYSNPAYDALVQRAVQSRDRTAATALWHEANDAINADAPAAWIFAPTTLGAVSSRFTNVTFQADQWAMNMWQWRVAPGKMIARDSVTATSTPPSR